MSLLSIWKCAGTESGTESFHILLNRCKIWTSLASRSQLLHDASAVIAGLYATSRCTPKIKRFAFGTRGCRFESCRARFTGIDLRQNRALVFFCTILYRSARQTPVPFRRRSFFGDILHRSGALSNESTRPRDHCSFAANLAGARTHQHGISVCTTRLPTLPHIVKFDHLEHPVRLWMLTAGQCALKLWS